jgi:hypothetical protein
MPAYGKIFYCIFINKLLNIGDCRHCIEIGFDSMTKTLGSKHGRYGLSYLVMYFLKRPLGLLMFATAGVTSASTMAQPAKVPDTMAERAIACTACHGKEGLATTEGFFPRLISMNAHGTKLCG